MEVPNNTSADNTSAIEQTVPPRGAMQGPACGELSYWSQSPKHGTMKKKEKKNENTRGGARYIPFTRGLRHNRMFVPFVSHASIILRDS